MTTPTSHPTSDREALSALFDGELTGDAARFALKRLDHDQDWRTTCDRWHLVGDALRGHGALLPATFPNRVRDAMHAGNVPSAATAGFAAGFPQHAPKGAFAAAAGNARTWRGPRWGSVALAASAAMVAFFLARQPATVDAPTAATQVASTTQVAPKPTQHAPKPQAPAAQVPDMPSDAEAASVAAVAVATIARPSSQRVRSMQRDRAATDRIVSQAVHADAAAVTPVTGEAPAILASQTDPARRDPFAEAAATPLQAPSRPWPRAVLPQYNGNGALAADYATAPSYYPFSPREPVQQRDTAPAREGVDASTQPAPQP
ncbi:MAG TPA: RseA family anti-sigma factor [Lysobacter sp.]|nr:RseA family anti-sigma factor [Lysobacter sp.]